MPAVIAILFIVIIFGLMIVLYFYNQKKEKERTLGMQAAAQQLGWAFAPNPPLDMIPHFNYFNLFNQGHSKNIRNMMYGQMNVVKMALFDYQYTVGSGKNRHTYFQSVIYFETPKLQLPGFTLSPEGLFHKLISSLGYQDIDFGNRPEFSKRYLLRGPDEMAIRQTFADQVLAYYEANQGLHTEGGGSQLFLYRPGYRVPPHEAAAYAQWGAAGVLNLFQRRW